MLSKLPNAVADPAAVERFVQIALEPAPETMKHFIASSQDATDAGDRVMLLICLHELFAAPPGPE